MKKRAQLWGIDLIVGTSIFIIGVILFYIYAFNYSSGSEDSYNSLSYDASIIADSLLSEGYPREWNSTSVVAIGISSSNKINQTKLERFYNLSIQDYERTKYLFNTQYDYYLNFSEPLQINGVNVEYIGHKSASQENIVKVSRITIYKNKLVNFDVILWE